MAWIDTPTGHRCTREGHGGEEFPRGEVCHFCTTDPGDGFEDDSPEDDDGDREQLARAAEYRSDEKILRRIAKGLLCGTDAEKALACKLFAEAVKLARLSAEVREPVLARAHDKALLEHERAMAGIGMRASH